MKNKLTLLLLLCHWVLFAQTPSLKDAQQQFAQKNYAKVIELLQNQQAPNEQIITLLGRSYLQLGKHKQAIQYLEQATRLNDQSAQLQYWLGMANFAILRSNIPFSKKGYYSHKVKKTLKAALALDSTHTKARMQLALYYLNAPKIAGGSTTKAMKHAQILRTYDKKSAYLLEASIYIKNKNYAKAEGVYLKSLKEAVHDQRIYYLLAEVNHQMKRYTKTFDYCEKSFQTAPEYLMAYYQFAKTAAQTRQRTKQGIAHARHYLSKDPDNKAHPGNHWVYYRLGLLHKIQHQEVAAKTAFERALKIKPGFKQAQKALSK